MRSRHFLSILLAVATLSPMVLSAQLRPDPKALEAAKSLRKSRASATEAAEALTRLRQGSAEVTAVLSAAGYSAREIGAVHRSYFRMSVDESAKTSVEALGRSREAVGVIGAVAPSAPDMLRVLRTELAMAALDAVGALSQAGINPPKDPVRLVKDLSDAGFSPVDAVAALIGLDGTPGEVFDAMSGQGASMIEIAQELVSAMGQTPEQVRELFVARAVPTEEGAAALDAIGSPMEVLYFVFRESIAQGNQDLAYFEERAQIASQYVASGSEAVALLAGRLSAGALAAVGVALAISQHESLQSAATAGAILEVVQALGEAGVTLADALGVVEGLGAAQDTMAGIVLAITGSGDATWTFLVQTLGWSANEAEEALKEIMPVTIGFLANLIGLGGSQDRIVAVIERLRDMGVSAVDIAAQVGQQMGILGMATALWDAGYGAAEVTGGLVQGMQAGVSEAAQVVAGLAGGE